VAKDVGGQLQSQLEFDEHMYPAQNAFV